MEKSTSMINFKYKIDGSFDDWEILEPNAEGEYVGDCEDLALTILYLKCDKSLKKFWKELIFGKAKILYCKYMGNGHAVLEYDGVLYDEGFIEGASKEEFEATGKYRFSKFGYLWPAVVIKMLLGKIF